VKVKRTVANMGLYQLLCFCSFPVPDELDVDVSTAACARGLSPVDCQMAGVFLLYGHVTFKK